jgi:hypothetical protein
MANGLVNFGIVNPELSDYAGQQQKRMQSQASKFELERLTNERKIMLDFQKQLADKGQNPDLDFVFDTMIKTGNPDYVSKGLEGKAKLQEQKEFARIMGYDMTPPSAGRAPAMTAPAGSAPVAAPVNALTANAPVAPANALVDQGMSDEAEKLKTQINGLIRLGNPQALKTADMLQKQLTSLEPTAAIREYKYSLKDPRFAEFQLKQRRAGATQVVLPSQEKAEQTERGKFLVEDYKGVSNAAKVAARTLPAIETNIDLLDKGFKTGFSTEVQKGAANILGALGVKDAANFATNAQVFSAKANETVLQRQLEQKGPQTEADAQRITQTGAQLTNTADANRFILDVAKAQLKRDIEQRNFYDSWWKKNKTYDGAEDAWYSGNGGKSLFERPELKQYNIRTDAPVAAAGKEVARQGKVTSGPNQGKTVIEYTDGTREYK